MKGAFTLTGIPVGDYTLEVEHAGFSKVTESVHLIIGSAPNLDRTLPLSSTSSAVDVTTELTPIEAAAPEAASPPVMVSRNKIMEDRDGL
jgi:hypothetical protein